MDGLGESWICKIKYKVKPNIKLMWLSRYFHYQVYSHSYECIGSYRQLFLLITVFNASIALDERSGQMCKGELMKMRHSLKNGFALGQKKLCQLQKIVHPLCTLGHIHAKLLNIVANWIYALDVWSTCSVLCRTNQCTYCWPRLRVLCRVMGLGRSSKKSLCNCSVVCKVQQVDSK